MSPTEHLRRLTAPDKSHLKTMLMGLALSIAGIGAVMVLKPPESISSVLVFLVFVSWFVGACAMVGYLRWFFASERLRAEQEKIESDERKDK